MTRTSPPRNRLPRSHLLERALLARRPRERRLLESRLRAYGMVDALVGILILAVVALSVSGAFSTLARLTRLQADRIDRLLEESDAAAHSAWY